MKSQGETVTKEITREALIEKLIEELIEYRQDNWDGEDLWDALYYGRKGYSELTNSELEETANEWFDGDMLYTISDADTHTVSEEERLRGINAELLEALKGLVGEIQLGKLNIRKDFSLINAHACASKAIAKAEGRA